jgi:serine/threonine protein kinase
VVRLTDKRPALRLEDPGGTVLEKRLGRPLELQLALRLGIGLASALSRFHAVGFIHRKLDPNNVFIDLDTGPKVRHPYTRGAY